MLWITDRFPRGNRQTRQRAMAVSMEESTAPPLLSTHCTSQLALSSGGGVSIAGLASKNPTGLRMKPM